MRKIILTSLLAVAAIGAGASQASAGGYGYGGGHVQQIQYGGGYGGGGYGGHGGGYRQVCHWERQHVRVWDETYQRWNWVWRRVRICR